MIIRPYKIGDEAGIAALVVPIQREEFGVKVTFEDQPDLLDVAGFFRQGVGEFWVALDDSRVVGTIGLKDMEGLADGSKAVALRKMFVAATHRGHELGIAQRLLETFHAHCVKLGVQRVILGTTQKYHAAHRFYERNGFTRIAEKDLPPNFPRMPVDDVFYEKNIDGDA